MHPLCGQAMVLLTSSWRSFFGFILHTIIIIIIISIIIIIITISIIFTIIIIITIIVIITDLIPNYKNDH